MSTSRARLYWLFLLILIPSVLALGFLDWQDTRSPVSNEPPYLDNTYQLIQPSVGILQQAHRAALQINGKEARIDITDIPVEPDMEVILYNAQNEPLPATTQINRVEDHIAFISLPSEAVQATSGEIILASNFMAKRLPHTVRNHNGLWRAVPRLDSTFQLEHITLPVPVLQDETYFDVGSAVRADDFVVLNPGGKLKNGALIARVEYVQNDAPTLAPQELAVQKAQERIMQETLAEFEKPDNPASDAAACAVSFPDTETP